MLSEAIFWIFRTIAGSPLFCEPGSAMLPDLTLHHPNTASGNIAESEKGVKNMSKQSHRTCVRMSVKDYELLKEKSAAAGLSANAWLMAQMKTNRPVLHREEETWEAVRFMDEAGREINAIARDFNSGYGTAEQLRHAICLLRDVYERLRAVRKMGYLHAA
jgi:hypothetical protein